MSRRRTKKTRFMTGFTIVMITFSIGLAIPSIIEGINVGRNWQSYREDNQVINPGSYSVVKWDIEDSNRISVTIRSQNSSYGEYVPMVFAILSEEEFSTWYDLGENKPNVINSTYYFETSDLNMENLVFDFGDEYYFIFYNTNAFSIYVDLSIESLPWGHIIATSVVGFGFALCFLGLLTKIGFTSYFILSNNEKPKVLTVQSQGKTEAILQPEKDENFCASCGAPITKKDGRYCPNCGSSA